MKPLFDDVSFQISKMITLRYSTSFSLGINLIQKKIRPAIYAIYGFVRLADEIVDSFTAYPQRELFDRFREDYKLSVELKVSANPILNSFQAVVHQYQLHDLSERFLDSMEMDLNKHNYNTNSELQHYIHGSAEVVGLMCLMVFTHGNQQLYSNLEPYAIKLGSAFQKINFLRDIQDDLGRLDRSYFPAISNSRLTDQVKDEILGEIKSEFDTALIGIKRLPLNCRFGVYLAYKYYLQLFYKLECMSAEKIIKNRMRVSNLHKVAILNKAFLRYKFNLL